MSNNSVARRDSFSPLRTIRAVFPHAALHVTLAARHSPNGSIGGAVLNAYTPGVIGDLGPNSIGLLVTVWGKVTQRDSSNQYFYIDDGSGLKDGTSTGAEQKIVVRVEANPTAYPADSYVTATGIVSCFPDNGLRPEILPRVGDIRILHP